MRYFRINDLLDLPRGEATTTSFVVDLFVGVVDVDEVVVDVVDVVVVGVIVTIGIDDDEDDEGGVDIEVVVLAEVVD